MADAMDMVADQSVRLSEVIDHIDTAMSSAAEQSSGISFATGAGCIDAMLAQLDSKDRGVMCKVIPPMDDLLGGARRKQMIVRSEEHTSELQSLMRSSYAVFCLKKNTHMNTYVISPPITFST